MALTLLVENNPKIADIYRLNLAVYAGLETEVVASAATAMEALNKPGFTLVISRARIGGEDSATLLASHLKTLPRPLPLVVIGAGPFPEGATGPMPGSLDLKSVVKGAAQALGITAQDMARRQVEKHFPLPGRYFEWVNHPACAVYHRGKDGAMEVLFPAHAKADRSSPAAQAALAGTVYVDALERLKMADQITAELLSQLDDADLNPHEQLQAQESNLEMLSQKLLTLGIQEETIALAKKGIQAMSANAKAYPKLGPLLKRMLENQSSYLFRHTQIVTYVCQHIVQRIDWGSPEQQEKIAFIAFFHDIALESDEQARIHGAEDLRTAGLDARSKELVEKHAQVAAELVSKYPRAPMGADQIVRQHHGMLNGIGFSDHFGANLSPLAILFIIAEEFTHILMAKEGHPPPIKDMARQLRESFPSNRFQKIIDLVETLSV